MRCTSPAGGKSHYSRSSVSIHAVSFSPFAWCFSWPRGVLTGTPWYCWECCTDLLNTPGACARGPASRLSLCVHSPAPFLGPGNSSCIGLTGLSAPSPHLRESLDTAWASPPCTTAWQLSSGSNLGQSQGSPHLFPDTVLCCLMSSVLKTVHLSSVFLYISLSSIYLLSLIYLSITYLSIIMFVLGMKVNLILIILSWPEKLV